MLGQFLFNAFSEDIVVRLARRIWEIAKGTITSGMGEAVKKKVGDTINSRGWEDESYFALDLAEADLTDDQKKNIQEGMRLAERYDKTRGTHSARNFRIVVTLNDKKSDDLKTSKRPGVLILEDLGARCATAKEIFLAIQAVGVMHDPKITFEYFLDTCERELLPFLRMKAGEIHAAAKTHVDVFDAYSRKEKPFWKKILSI